MADGSGTVIGGVEIQILAGTNTFNKELVQAEQRARKAGGVMAQQFDVADKAAVRLASSLKSTTSALGAIGAGFGAASVLRGVVEMADSMSLLRGRIANVVKEGESVTGVFNDIYNSAQRNRASLEATAQLYLRLRTSIKDLTHEQALGISTTFGQTLKISGANAAEAASATLQFAQAMSKGRLDGDELRSVLEADSRFAILLADSLGVTVGQLRDLGEAGVLTGGIIKNALSSSAIKVQAEFDRIPTNVGDAFQQLQNAIVKYVGETDTSFGASQRVAGGIAILTQNIGTLADGLVALSSGAVAGAAVAGIAAVGNAVNNLRLVLQASITSVAARSGGGIAGLSGNQVKALEEYISALDRARNARTHLLAVQEAYDSATTLSAKYALTAELARSDQTARAATILETRLKPAADAAFAASSRAYSGIEQVLNGVRIGANRTAQAVLSAFGGPVGLAITAASIAMAVFTENQLAAARASRQLETDLDRIDKLRSEGRSLVDELAAANERVTEAIKEQAPVAEETARRDIAAIDERIKKNKELLRTVTDAAETELQKSRSDDTRKTNDEHNKLIAAAASSPGKFSPAENKAASNFLDQSGDFFRAITGGGVYGDIDKNVGDSLIAKARDQAQQDIAAGRELTRSQQTIIDIFRDAGERKENIEKQAARLNDLKKPPADSKVNIGGTEAERKYKTAIDTLRASTNKDELSRSQIARNAIEDLGKTELPEARRQFESIRDLLTPKDEAGVQSYFIQQSKAVAIFKDKLKESLTPAQEFAKVLKDIQGAGPDQGNKSRAALEALRDYGKELKDLPDAFAALNDKGSLVNKFLKPEDAARARRDLRLVAIDAGAAFGTEAQQAGAKYADQIDKIAKAEAALAASGASTHIDFDASRAQALQEYRDTVKGFTEDFSDLAEVVNDTKTPVEKLTEALIDLDNLQSGTSQGAIVDQAIARAKINLLEGRAKAAGKARNALLALNQLQAAAGLSDKEVRAARERILAGASAGRAGSNIREVTDQGRREEAANLFASTFTDAITQGIKSGNFGEALKQVVLTKAAEGLSEAIFNVGKDIGNFLFNGAGGQGSAVLDTAGRAEIAAANTAQAASATAAAVAFDVAATAAGALAAAMAAAAGTSVTSTGAGIAGIFGSAFTSGIAQNAGGGGLRPGELSIVGEAGPEVFQAGASGGFITGNAALRGARRSQSARESIVVRQGDVIVQGDVGNSQQIQAMREEMRAQVRDTRRVIQGTVKDINRRR